MNNINTIVATPNPRVLNTVRENLDEPVAKFGKSALTIATVMALYLSGVIGKVRSRVNTERKAQSLDPFTGYEVQVGILETGSEQFGVTDEEKTLFGARLKSLLNATDEGKETPFKFISTADIDEVILECSRWAVNHPSNDKLDRNQMAEYIDGIDVIETTEA